MKTVERNPSWAKRIRQLRERLGLSQSALAKKLRCSSMSISRWERGINEPPAQFYLALGKLAGKPQCWFFWGRVKLSKAYVRRLL
jgi:transcriptional regulator with XRE-family HTH domain